MYLNDRYRGIVKVSLNTGEESVVQNRPIIKMFLDGDWIYYIDKDSDSIYKVKLDGSEKELIIADEATNLIVHGEWIYFTRKTYYWRDDKASIYRIKKDGTEMWRMNNFDTSKFNICGEWIYLVNQEEHDSLYRMRLNGEDLQLILRNDTYYPDASYSASVTSVYKYDEWTIFKRNTGTNRRKLFFIKDGESDIQEISKIRLIIKAFESFSEFFNENTQSQGYDKEYDMNEDGIIDILDFVEFSKQR